MTTFLRPLTSDRLTVSGPMSGLSVHGISLRRSSIFSEKVLFRVQVMKRKREKLTILKKVPLYLFVNCIRPVELRYQFTVINFQNLIMSSHEAYFCKIIWFMFIPHHGITSKSIDKVHFCPKFQQKTMQLYQTLSHKKPDINNEETWNNDNDENFMWLQ